MAPTGSRIYLLILALVVLFIPQVFAVPPVTVSSSGSFGIGRNKVSITTANNNTFVFTQDGVRVRLDSRLIVQGKKLKVKCNDRNCTCEVEPTQARDRIKEMLIKHLNISVPEENITDLEIVVKGDHAYYVYRHKVHAKLLWILPIEVPVEVDVDVETGGATIVKPWWWIFITSVEYS